MLLDKAIHFIHSILFLFLFLGGVGTGLSQKVEELIPRDERNISVRNEVETASRKGLEYLHSQQEANGLVRFGGADTLSRSARALALLSRDHDRFPAELHHSATNTLRANMEAELGKIDPPAELSTARHLIQSWSSLSYVDHEDPAQTARVREMIRKKLQASRESSNLAQATPSPGLINSEGRPVKLEDWTDIVWLYDEQDLRRPGSWQQTPLHRYFLSCQIREGPEAGGFTSWSSNVPKAGDRSLPSLSATIAGLEYLIANAPASEGVASAFAWLGRHYPALSEQPFPMLQQLTRSLAHAKLSKLTLPSGQKVDLARTWAERLVNEQEGNGTWKARADWVEQDPLALTLEGVELLETLYQAL